MQRLATSSTAKGAPDNVNFITFVELRLITDYTSCLYLKSLLFGKSFSHARLFCLLSRLD